MFFRVLKSFILTLVCFSLAHPLLASGTTRPDSHAPIGVMGDHTHNKGEFMASYRWMHMFMDGNRSGTSSVSTADVLRSYMVAPVRMKMEMHMAGLMYAPCDRVTLMAMIPEVRLSMDHVNRMGRTFNTETRGLGDITASALIVLLNQNRHKIHANAGVSFPTGVIDERDDTLMPDQPLPYPMQLGSGTVDLLPGVTYNGFSENWSWGGQTTYVLRLGDNDRNYTLGDRFKASVWGARKIADWVSSSLRLAGESWGDIDGRDSVLNPAMVATADPNLRAGDRIDFLFGVNVLGTGSWVKDHRLAIELGFPIYERLDGPQLETDTITTLAWQKAF